ncbi:hypothetical protein CNMCM5623_004815 [Aspergillus felis]|uniref:Survival protein SurE-like phosphatase/nucleotidase domain-containing protein n=1 Tax=Aspergillus felis TaxID=1287682 RepID=A0A8H6UM52_9EURO|nr:hypothetical protein CNMCM5623_004815 [Aspergillus felis]
MTGRPVPRIHLSSSLSLALQAAGHLISVILPAQQRSWIGKAHFIDTLVTPTDFYPELIIYDEGDTVNMPSRKTNEEDKWVLANSTPASCVQLGLYHYFKDRDPVDLVVSGPNLGRNSTTLFALSSGTIGAALEAALCGKRAVALSFAHKSDKYDPVVIQEAASHSVQLLEHLYNIWADDVDLYSVNIPLEVGMSAQKIMYTSISKKQWSSDGAFCSINREEPCAVDKYEHKQFQWAPRLDNPRNSGKGSSPGDNEWAIAHGMTSVTPLQANFLHSSVHKGEISLPQRG